MNPQSLKVLKIFLIVISAIIVIAIAVSAIIKKTAKPIGLSTFAKSKDEILLIQIDSYQNNRVLIGSSSAEITDQNYRSKIRGIRFKDNLVQFVSQNIEPMDFEQIDTFSYDLHDNDRLTFLGMDEHNNDFIIVERIELDDATIFRCRECGDEMWYVLASDIDFSSRKIEEETNEYGSKEYSLWYNLK